MIQAFDTGWLFIPGVVLLYILGG